MAVQVVGVAPGLVYAGCRRSPNPPAPPSARTASSRCCCTSGPQPNYAHCARASSTTTTPPAASPASTPPETPAAPLPSPVSWFWPTGRKAPSSGSSSPPAAARPPAPSASTSCTCAAANGATRSTGPRQIEALEREPCQYAPVPHEVVDTTTSAAGPDGALTVFLDLPDDAATVPEDAVKDAVEDLDVDRIDGFGAIPQPNADFAHQLQDLVTTDH